MNTETPEMPDAAFTLTWRNGAYRVDKPDIGTTKCYTEDQMREMWRAANARAEGLEADARRYQWLRDSPWTGTPMQRIIWQHRNAEWDQAIDAAIDAAQAVRSEASEGEG